MATTVKIRIRRDTTANWMSLNPVLTLGEIAADMDLHRIKVGDGTSAWNVLPWFDGEIINTLTSDRTDAPLSAKQGKELKSQIDTKTSQTEFNELKNKVEGFGTFGQGYDITEWNGYGKPTKIVFEDGVTATLTWTGANLVKIVSSTGETINLKYNTAGSLTGREVLRS